MTETIMTEPYQTRFAPSPTGRMHLGHARTHLVTWLRARSVGGSITMRFEDLDRPRVVAGAADDFLRDHEWLGLDWDHGPIFQSDREALYTSALSELAGEGRVFPCTCSRKDIASVASAPHGDLGPRYPGTCRTRPSQPGRPESIRFRSAESSRAFSDALLGEQKGTVDDFVVRRADGIWSYQFAVVVDDADMNMTEVIRGADLLSSTPRQLALYDAFGSRPPRFMHVPLVRMPDGQRLAKRNASIAIADQRDAGQTSQDVLGLLGHSLGLLRERRPASLDELRARFQLSRLHKGEWTLPPEVTASKKTVNQES